VSIDVLNNLLKPVLSAQPEHRLERGEHQPDRKNADTATNQPRRCRLTDESIVPILKVAAGDGDAVPGPGLARRRCSTRGERGTKCDSMAHKRRVSLFSGSD
jgi:hypothetical protein